MIEPSWFTLNDDQLIHFLVDRIPPIEYDDYTGVYTPTT